MAHDGVSKPGRPGRELTDPAPDMAERGGFEHGLFRKSLRCKGLWRKAFAGKDLGLSCGCGWLRVFSCVCPLAWSQFGHKGGAGVTEPGSGTWGAGRTGRKVADAAVLSTEADSDPGPRGRLLGAYGAAWLWMGRIASHLPRSRGDTEYTAGRNPLQNPAAVPTIGTMAEPARFRLRQGLAHRWVSSEPLSTFRRRCR